MGRIVVTEYISVDGVVEAPSGTEHFERVGWTDAFERGPEGDKFKLDETMASDALLLGRVTYDGFAPVWPHYRRSSLCEYLLDALSPSRYRSQDGEHDKEGNTLWHTLPHKPDMLR